MPLTPDDAAPGLARATGRTPVAWTPMDEGAYSPSGRWLVRFADGGTAFVKAERAWSDEHGVAVERRVYAALDLPCLPRLLGFDAGPPLVLATEDLSHARWGTPVTAADATALRAAFDLLATVPPPEGLHAATGRKRWPGLAADPARLLATGLVDAAWAAAHLPALVAAEAGADARGDALLHGDVWLQNWCRTERGVVIVDWAPAHVGNPLVNYAGGEAAVRSAGGPPGVVLSGRPEWAAWAAGQTAYYLAEAPPDVAPRLLETLRREALATLRWACADLRLPLPEVAPPFGDLGPWRP